MQGDIKLSFKNERLHGIAYSLLLQTTAVIMILINSKICLLDNLPHLMIHEARLT